MLTRLKISGFKNLVDVDVRFGSFTCIAGPNGSGKSNLFDAVHFLSALAEHSLMDAALSVRDESGRMSDIRNLFHRVGDSYDEKVSFEAEMIIPEKGIDDLGQEAKASITFLRYTVVLAYRPSKTMSTMGSLEIIQEELTHINQQDAREHLLFPFGNLWLKSAIKGRRGKSPFISTVEEDGKKVIKLHQHGTKGKPLSRLASQLPRTVLSVANAAESPTVLLARREMQSWRLLQLEPSVLRMSDNFTAPARLGTDGSHLAATLYRLAQQPGTSICSQVANHLSQLIDDVADVWVDRDDTRELLTLKVKDKNHTCHPAQSLSDGTLRFLALAVLEQDSEAQGLLCLEEPENGIHPKRIPAIIELLQDICTDTKEPVNSDNPLRQVIINTHSPSVVNQVPEGSLLVAKMKEAINPEKNTFLRACFGCLPNTWRIKNSEEADIIPKGDLLSYLNPVRRRQDDVEEGKKPVEDRVQRRVIDREDIQKLIQSTF